MTTSIQQLIEHIPSPQYLDDNLISTDRSILSRRQVEIIPREASTFGQQTANNVAYNGTLNSKVTFYVSDPRHYADLANTYFQCEFKCGASSSAGADIQAYLDKGGIHSLIRSLVIRSGSVEMLNLDGYNKLYAAGRLATKSPQEVDFSLGDSLDSYRNVWEETGDE